jgi:uncharacterized protein YggE
MSCLAPGGGTPAAPNDGLRSASVVARPKRARHRDGRGGWSLHGQSLAVDLPEMRAIHGGRVVMGRNRVVPGAVLVLVSVFLVPCARADEFASRPAVSVSGSAELKVPPDEIYLDLGVEVKHEDLDAGKAESDRRVAAVVGSVRAAGAAEEDVQTDYLGIEPTYDDRVSRTVPVTYTLQRSIGVRLRRVAEFEKVLTAALKAGANYVHGVEFRTSELRRHRDAARRLAVRAARGKAEALVRELGGQLGRVLSVSESYWGGSWTWSGGGWRGGRFRQGYQNVVQSAGAGGEAPEGTLSVGQIGVSATVSVSFAIE